MPIAVRVEGAGAVGDNLPARTDHQRARHPPAPTGGADEEACERHTDSVSVTWCVGDRTRRSCRANGAALHHPAAFSPM